MAAAEPTQHAPTIPEPSARQVNPHFDDGRVVWDDAFSGQYEPVAYDRQFDDQWRLFLERKVGFCQHTGVETSDPWIDGRIFEITGVPHWIERRKWRFLFPLVQWLRARRGFDEARRGVGGRLYLEPKFAIDRFRGTRCLDVGCGAGRWTRALLALGARVKSVDVSEHALRSVRRFNDDVEQLDLFGIERRPDLHEAFDFTLCWGVVMCTHDPKAAFRNVARTVAPGGQLYAMVYAPTYHASPQVLERRKHYHRELHGFEERLAYAYEIADTPANAINLLDMLNTFYNWVIPEDVIHGWFREQGFVDVVTLNRNEPHNCAWHVLGTKAGTGSSSRLD
jgi:SAM-dependent methyltransferase